MNLIHLYFKFIFDYTLKEIKDALQNWHGKDLKKFLIYVSYLN